MRIVTACAALALMASSAAAQSSGPDRLRVEQLQQDNVQAQARTNDESQADADLRDAVAEQQRRQSQANLRATSPEALSEAKTAAQTDRIVADDRAFARLEGGALAAGDDRMRKFGPDLRTVRVSGAPWYRRRPGVPHVSRLRPPHCGMVRAGRGVWIPTCRQTGD